MYVHNIASLFFSFCQKSTVFAVCRAWYFNIRWTVVVVKATHHSSFVSDTIGWNDLQELIYIHIYTGAQLISSAMCYLWENCQLRHTHWHYTPGVHQNQFSPVFADLTEITHNTKNNHNLKC